MIRASGLVASSLVVASCSASTAPAHGDYKALPVPGRTYSNAVEVFLEEYKNFPEGAEGNQILDLHLERGVGGSTIVLLTEKGLLDDAVGAIQYQAVIKPDVGGWRVLHKGERWQCRRGPASGWTTTPCN